MFLQWNIAPFHQDSGSWMVWDMVNPVSLIDMSHCLCCKMSFLVSGHIMWDTNIKKKVLSKYTGGKAGRSVVEEEV